MNEHSFVKGIHRRLPKGIYRWKIHDQYTNGVPDAWYSGPGGDLWVEYKYLKIAPKRSFTPKLTKLQLRWLLAREREGRFVAVVVGSPDGVTILRPQDCTGAVNVAAIDWITVEEYIAWLRKHLL